MNKTVCLFGTYDYDYSRNSSIRDGLKLKKVKVTELHYKVPLTRLEAPEDFTVMTSLKRLINKLKTWGYFIKKRTINYYNRRNKIQIFRLFIS